MSFQIACKCGKLLRAKDEWRGKQFRCPSCKSVILVPTEDADESEDRITRSKAVKIGRTPSKSTVSENTSELVDKPRKNKGRRNKKKKAFRLDVPDIDILGIHMTLRKWIMAICIVGLLSGIIYILVPSYHCKVLEARFVDIYGALDVANRNIGKEFLGMTDKSKLYPGTEKFLVIRESPQGESVLLRLKLPPKFLAERANSRQGTLVIESREFQLKGDGEPVDALILDLERSFADAEQGTTIDITNSTTTDPALPRDRSPWTHSGEVVGEYKAEMVPVKDDLLERSVPVIIGNATFEGKRGMKVHYKFGGTVATVTWDAQSKGYVGNKAQEYIDRFMLESLELTCVFPRPAGKQLSLTVMREVVGRISPQ